MNGCRAAQDLFQLTLRPADVAPSVAVLLRSSEWPRAGLVEYATVGDAATDGGGCAAAAAPFAVAIATCIAFAVDFASVSAVAFAAVLTATAAAAPAATAT